MKILKTIYYFVATLVLIIVGIDMLQNTKIAVYEVLLSIAVIAAVIVCLFLFIMIVWEEYQDYKQNKNKNE